MADDADVAADLAQSAVEAGLAANNPDIPPGNPGDCDLCGRWSGRLVEGACAPCRDRYRLP